MARIACVLVPHLPAQALERADPELGSAPLVVCEGRDVIDLAPAARKLGVAVGMTIFQARAVAPEAIYRARSLELERAAEAALADLGASFSPRVEPTGNAIALDVSDLGRLFESESQIANALYVGARKLGLAVRVGVAGDKRTARIAARAGEVQVVAAGQAAAFLAPLPVELLEPSPETLLTLQRWGVRRIGELESLPPDGLALRLGAEGAELARVARGEAEIPLNARAEAITFEEGIDFEYPVENVEPLLFILRRLLENLTARLACRALASGDLGMTLKLSPRGRDVRVVPVAAPTRDVGTLLGLVRLALESSPPPAAVESLMIRTTPARTRPAQLGLFTPAGPSPDKLASTLARLSVLVGEGRVGAPALQDRHLPDAYTLRPFAAPRVAPRCNEAPASGDDLRQLALHALRPPLQAEARLDRGELRYVTSAGGVAGQVLAAAGPFRVRDGWWQQYIVRDYYDVQLSDGAVYRLFHDLQEDSWHIDGCYE
jgi:protein ImuB